MAAMHFAPERPFTLVHPDGERLRGLIHETRGDTVGIYIPGFASHMQGNKARLLAQTAQARGRSWIRFDQRGTGVSDGSFAALTLSRCLADVRLLLKLIAPRSAVLVGSSLGGWLAVLAASRWPEQVRAMLLLAPSFNFVQRWYGELPATVRAEWARRGMHRFQDRYGGPDYDLNFDIVADAWRYDLLRWPPSLHCPVRILHGGADEVVPVAVSEAFAKAVDSPHITLEVLPGADHRLSGQERTLLDAVDALWPQEDGRHV